MKEFEGWEIDAFSLWERNTCTVGATRKIDGLRICSHGCSGEECIEKLKNRIKKQDFKGAVIVSGSSAWINRTPTEVTIAATPSVKKEESKMKEYEGWKITEPVFCETNHKTWWAKRLSDGKTIAVTAKEDDIEEKLEEVIKLIELEDSHPWAATLMKVNKLQHNPWGYECDPIHIIQTLVKEVSDLKSQVEYLGKALYKEKNNEHALLQ